jgi:hypothetical protein
VPFQGVLCLFLLDMGLVVGRSPALKRLSLGLVVVALVAPLGNGCSASRLAGRSGFPWAG